MNNLVEIYFNNGSKKVVSYSKIINAPSELIVEEDTINGKRTHFFQKINIKEFVIPNEVIKVSKIISPPNPLVK